MPSYDLQKQIIGILNEKGPLLGKEIIEELGSADYLPIWRTCFQSQIFQISHFARYYLRYDLGRENLIRLSPSILRDFLSFTLVSLPHQREEVINRQTVLSNRHREISLYKMNIARNIALEILENLSSGDEAQICIFVAGDISYFLGHDEPRESESLGKVVSGSDIDIIILHEDNVSSEVVEMINSVMLKQKHFYYKHPDFRQEVDFICKPLSKMEKQFSYETITDKIACKILYESTFICGSLKLYMHAQKSMELASVVKLIEADFMHGLDGRRAAIPSLLSSNEDNITRDSESLFFFSQERVEFT